MSVDFELKGHKVILRPTSLDDIEDYKRWDDPHATAVGIVIQEENQWRKGIGTEALALWIDYLFKALDLTRIGFTTWQGNPMMLGLGKKLGFVEEARIRRSCFVKGRFFDRISMGILREEWEEKRVTFSFLGTLDK